MKTLTLQQTFARNMAIKNPAIFLIKEWRDKAYKNLKVVKYLVVILSIVFTSCSTQNVDYLHTSKDLQLQELQRVVDVNVVLEVKGEWVIFESTPEVVDSFQTKYATNIQAGDVFSQYYSRY